MRLVRTLFAAACLGTVAFAQLNSLSESRNQLSWRPYMDGQQSNVTRPGVQVLDSESAFRAYYQKTLGKDPISAPRNVDWNREELLAIHLGQRKTGGFRVTPLRLIKGTDLVVRITATEWTPVPGAYVSEGNTSPWVIVRIDRVSARFALDIQSRQTPPGLPFTQGSNGPGVNGGGGRCSCVNCPCGCGCGG